LEEAPRLKSYLEARLPYEVLMSFGRNETENILTHKPVQLFIYDTQDFQNDEASFLLDMRNLGYIYPILVLAKSIDNTDFINSDKIKTHFLEKPFEFKALNGLTRKLMTQRSIVQQKFRRFKTHQPAQIETYLTAETLDSKMFNLSMGGAYVEFAQRPSIGIGDLVKIQVPLADLSRRHQMNAKVVWTTRKGTYSGGFGVGVRFIKDKDVYRQLMEKM
jgi:Tfp pilus assembly protein PilZ